MWLMLAYSWRGYTDLGSSHVTQSLCIRQAAGTDHTSVETNAASGAHRAPGGRYNA